MSATNRGAQRDHRDFYQTPRWCVDALLEAEDIQGNVLDPGCGDGAILSAVSGHPGVHAALGVELDDSLAEAAIASGPLGRLDVISGDFLEYAEKVSPHAPFDCAVGNPPYRMAAEFARAALRCVKAGGKVAFLLRLNFLGSSRKRLDLVGPSSSLAHVIVLARRPSFSGNGRTDATDYAWMGWENAPRTGPPRLSVVVGDK